MSPTLSEFETLGDKVGDKVKDKGRGWRLNLHKMCKPQRQARRVPHYAAYGTRRKRVLDRINSSKSRANAASSGH